MGVGIDSHSYVDRVCPPMPLAAMSVLTWCRAAVPPICMHARKCRALESDWVRQSQAHQWMPSIGAVLKWAPACETTTQTRTRSSFGSFE
jgi:hypothetical protein